MKGYESYKNSGLKWIGTIPEKWEIGALKHCFKFKVGFTPPTSNEKYYIDADSDDGCDWITIGDLNSKYIFNSKYKISVLAAESYNKDIIPKGSLLYSFKLSVGKVAFAGKDIYTNEAILSILPDANLELSYYYYCLPAILIHNANENIYGAKIFNQEVIKNSKLPIPTLKEQTTIASFLDYKTNLIDATIEKKKHLIELLKEKRQTVINEAVTKGLNPNAPMKDSGVPSFGKIPLNWIVTKLKFISNVKGRIGFRGYTVNDLVDEGQGALVLGASHITWEGEIDLSNPVFISWEKYEESPEIKLDKGDIIVVQRGSTCGKVAIISEEIGKSTINPSLVVLKNIKANSFYVFSSIKAAIDQLVNLTRSSAIPMLSQEEIGNLEIVLPPIDEQYEIDKYLNQFEKKYSDLINKCHISILKLQTYRQSLISEAVTGKIDLRDWKIPVN